MPIRPAHIADASSIAVLSEQLGYPSAIEAIERRLSALISDTQHGVFVAEEDVVVGWIHVTVMHSVESDAYAEIRGLVVDELHRGKGIGTQLIKAAEKWTSEKGFKKIRIRTNVVRTETIEYYKKCGYAITKTQRVFDKDLGKI